MTPYRLAENHIFEYGDNIYVFHVNKFKGFRINEALRDEIQSLKMADVFPVESLSDELRSALDKMDLLRDNKLPRKPQIKMPQRQPVATISLNVAQLCNLSCIYCYGVDGEYGEKGLMKGDTAFEAVDWLFEQSMDYPDLTIQFFGGEPLLNFSQVKKVVAYANEKAAAAGKNMHFSMTTNGTMFTDEINKFLNDNNFAMMVSFDGNAEMQNKNRPFKGGQGSYEVAQKRIRKFLASRDAKATIARATITGNNTDLEEVRRSLVDLGFKSASAIQVTMPNSSIFPEEEKKRLQKEKGKPSSCATKGGCGSKIAEAPKSNTSFEVKLDTSSLKMPKLKKAKILEQTDSQIHANEFERIMADIKFRAIDTLDKIKKRKNIPDKFILDLIHRLYNKKPLFYFCGGGRTYMSVSVSGDIYPCHRMVGQKDKKIGHIRDWDPAQQKPYIHNYGMGHEKCSGCFARFFCGGGCFQESIENNGSMAEPHDEWCQQMRSSLEHAIVIYDNLDIFDKAHLGMLKKKKKDKAEQSGQQAIETMAAASPRG